MYHWKKLGRPFIPQDVQDRPWLAEFAQAPATLILQDRVRVYFSCRPRPDERGQYTSFSAYVDLDRSNLMQVLDFAEQPILALGDTGCFDEFGTYPVTVVPEGDTHVAYYAGWTRCESVPFNVAIGRAVSTDGGRTFQKSGPGPVLAYTPDEPFVISGPKIRRFNGQWWLYYIAGRKWKIVDGRAEPVYKIRMAVSDDGLHWERQHRDLIESRVEADEAQASPDVIFSGGRYHMFFCYRHSENYRGRQGGYRIGYAHSADGLHWTRDDDQAGLHISDSGFDDEMVAYPHVFELDGRTYMAYLGNGVGRHGFGIAELQGRL